MTTIGAESWAVALPSLRLPASAYKAAWGSCSARGMTRKTVCAFDEDPVTLGAAAAVDCLTRAEEGAAFSALFVGATTLPYEEKPSSASLLQMIDDRNDLRVVELRGSPQAGLQALLSAREYAATHPGERALAVATDAPRAHPATGGDHALGAGAAAFLFGERPRAAVLESPAASRETFGSRFRREGSALRDDLELRVDDDGKSLALLGGRLGESYATVALGLDERRCAKAVELFGAQSHVSGFAELGDLGAAAAPVALAQALDGAEAGDRILAVALGAGATALGVESKQAVPWQPFLPEAAAYREITYVEYLKHTGFLARPER